MHFMANVSFDFGYGVDLEKLEEKELLAPSYAQAYMDSVATPSQKEAFREFCKEYDLDPSDPEAVEEFVDGYEDENYDQGLFALVKAALNERNECDNFFIEKGFLYYSAYIPADEAAKSAMKTEEDLLALYAQHFNPLLRDGETVDVRTVRLIQYET